ncbi:hypothetical protein DBR39_12675 [Chryseobacterium sp. KBW03]|uniref:DUF1281 family ferredoxin-like fold protein n=1 Tax=Bacteroidota TaxID=976 RepID=UPI000F5AEBED|nr:MULTISPECIES: hypothetical protein [Bacteroidota]RQO37738.1 hypothetical protein DBR39_12675 [Chryseobacterium sp. KBW03]
MANWCNNTLVFVGTPEAIQQITALFNTIVQMEQQIDFEKLPDFLGGTEDHFFCDISYNHDGMLEYDTRWTPNIQAVVRIAKHYKVDFVLGYQEIGNCLYGMATYANGVLKTICLDPMDFGRF